MQLFGDESFYWLEAQFLDWSYAELPGWNAWMIRLGTELFGNNYIAVRFFSFVAYLSIFWLIFIQDKHKFTTNYFVPFSVPIVSIIATMALPDIWLLFFVMWASYFFIRAINSLKTNDWVITGLILACSINVHVRMWIWLFFAGIVFLVVFYKQVKIIKPALLITLPISLLGLIPVIVFNLEHDFALLSFQFSQRHPWQFQLSNINFLLSQFIVVTPLVLLLWFRKVLQFSNNKVHNWVIITALLHWLFYVITSLFADGLRTNVHWLIISYVPVLLILGKSKFKKWAVITGVIASFILLIMLSFNSKQNSNLQTRLLDNSMGWQHLAKQVKRIQVQHDLEAIVADYFMTASELAFELDEFENIKVLSHEKNSKHGREKQLKIMGMLLEKPQTYKQPALLVVEDSTLKLQGKGKYYQNLCSNFKQLKFIESIFTDKSSKLHHVFKLNTSVDTCDLPPLFYVNSTIKGNMLEVSGWTIIHNNGIKILSLESGGKTYLINNFELKNSGIKKQFPHINDANSPKNGFLLSIPAVNISNNSFRIVAKAENSRKYYSQLYFIK